MKAAVLAVVVTGLSACATLFGGGGSQQVKISSVPEGAKVYVAKRNAKGVLADKILVGVTPMTINLARKNTVVLLEKEGYEPAEVATKTRMNPWVWGDIIATSLLSTSIDTSTGASREYDPSEYMVEMKATEAAQPAAEAPVTAPVTK